MIRAGLLRLGGSMLEQLLAADHGHRGPRVPCGPGHEAVFTGYRDKSSGTVLGLVTLTRAWYHCAACGHGLAPRDAELGVAGTSMSPGLAAMNDRAAAAGPFARAAGLLGDLAGVRADRQAGRAGRRVQRHRPGRGARRAGPRLIAARKLVPLPPVAAAGQALRRHRRHRRAHDLEGDRRAGTARAKTAAPAPARSSSACFFTQDKLDEDGYPVRDRDSSSLHRHLRTRQRVRRPGGPRASAAAPTTSGSSPSSATARPGSVTPISG